MNELIYKYILDGIYIICNKDLEVLMWNTKKCESLKLKELSIMFLILLTMGLINDV